MQYADIEQLAGAAPLADADELCELADRTRAGDATARDLLTMVLLPRFCAVYPREAGRWRDEPELLHDCLDRFLQLVTEHDFHRQGEGFSQRLAGQLQQARADYIAAHGDPRSDLPDAGEPQS